MRIWEPEDDQLLRDALRDRLSSVSKELRKRHRKVQKVKPLWQAKCGDFLLIFVFLGALWGFLFLPVFGKAAEMENPVKLSLILFFYGGVHAVFVRAFSACEAEINFSRYYPIPFEAVFNVYNLRFRKWQVGSGLISLAYFAIWCAWFSKPDALLIYAFFHALALQFSALALSRIPNGWHAAILSVSALGAWFGSLYELQGIELLDVLASFLPNGWVLRSAEAYSQGEYILAFLWISPLILYVPLLRVLKKYQLKELELAYDRIEPERDPSGEIEVGCRPLPVNYGKVSLFLRKQVHPDLRTFVDYYAGPLGGSDLFWKRGVPLALAGFGFSFSESIFLFAPGLLLLIGFTLCITPLLGGGWFTGTDEDDVPVLQRSSSWPFFPIDFRILFHSMLRVNVCRCLLAFPFWLLCGCVLGFREVNAVFGTVVAGCLWSCVVLVQYVAAVLKITENRVAVVRGKYWRSAVSMCLMFTWFVALLASVILSFFVLHNNLFFLIWMLTSGLGVGGMGWVMSIWGLREVCGSCCDLVRHHK